MPEFTPPSNPVDLTADATNAGSRALFERHPQPMWIYALDTLQFLDVNEVATRTYGWTREEFLRMRLPDIRPAEEVERLLTDIQHLQKPWSQSSGWHHRLKSGEIIDVEIVSHVTEYYGRPARLVVVRDVTEQLAAERARADAERALRDAEERMRFALTASHVGVWEADLRSGLTYWSETCEALHGLAAGAFGRTFEAFVSCIHPDDRERIVLTIQQSLEARREFELQYRAIWPDGTERQIRATAHFLCDEGGTPIRGAGVSFDVTDRVRLEEQLRHSQKMDAIGQLAGGIAHDFNNLLTVIVGSSEFLLSDIPEGDPRRSDVEDIRQAGARGAQLTSQLLAFSRKEVVEPSVLRIGDVVKQVAPLLRRLLGETIELETIAGDCWQSMVNAGQIEQVIMNLAINARDAMPDGGRLVVETSETIVEPGHGDQVEGLQPGPHVVIAVTDTGHGMDAATRARIFEPFFTTKPRERGTGLGLATVYAIVKQSRGHISVQSQVGKGTTFKIYLPRANDI